MARAEHDVLETCRDLLRAGGGRCTGARLRVLEAIRAHGGHLTATQIHGRIGGGERGINISTVYRSLERLTELGLLHTVRGLGGDLSYGLLGEPHHHFLCTGCGRVVDFPHRLVSAGLVEAGRRAGFRAESLVISGVCEVCQGATER
ncbi:Fur family transcriptional regulator [Kitasatospora sp. NPDC048365]|uniref:Fur family transcriptional regulator n=1 Tax=Kitasatospora sp. NPDC048365 TaxID=3364050 RepID=UPI003720192E